MKEIKEKSNYCLNCPVKPCSNKGCPLGNDIPGFIKAVREEDYEKLCARMKEMGIATDPLYWYLDLRRYGSNIHSGFGLGFERLLMYITGIENIRDVIPYPRTPNNCDF